MSCLCWIHVSMLIPVCECLCDMCEMYVCVCQCWLPSVWLISCVGGQAESTLPPTWQQLSTEREGEIKRAGMEKDSDRKTEGAIQWLQWFSRYSKHVLVYCKFCIYKIVAGAFISLFYLYVWSGISKKLYLMIWLLIVRARQECMQPTAVPPARFLLFQLL